MPDSEESIDKFCADLGRARNEFGYHYAFIPAHKLYPFVARLKAIIPLEVRSVKVAYSDDSLKWSIGCKSERYSYQREYRFVVGECEHGCVEPYCVRDEPGFSEYILKNPEVKIGSKKTGDTWFSISGETVVTHNQSHRATPKSGSL